jgi:hypothetical protein
VTAPVKTRSKRQRARTFSDGFVMGLAAPSLLVSGFLTELTQRPPGLGNAWKDVGQFIRESSDTHRATTEASRRDKRRA